MTRIHRPVLAAAGTAVAAALVLTSCAGGGEAVGPSAEPTQTGPSTLAIATMTAAQSMDPTDAAGGSIPYFQAVYDTLVRRQADGTLTPMLATEWQWDETGTALTITLRDDVTFDDGTPLDAEAVKANLDRFKETGGAEVAQAGTTESVEVTGEHTLVIHTTTPDPALVHYLSDAYGFVANPAAFGSEDALATAPDGTGPYELDTTATVIGSAYTFVRAEDYWGEELPFDEITITVFDNENAIVNGLKTGQVDAAVLQSVDQQIAAEQDDALTMTPQEIDLKLFNIFDRSGSKVEALGDVRVRQAINLAIDRATLVEQIQQGRGTATSQVWGVDAPGYLAELDSYWPYDPDAARDLMAEAGYSDGVEISLARLPGLVDDALAAALRTNLEDIGITLTWEDVDQQQFIQRTFYEQEFPGVVMNGGQPSLDWATLVGSVLPSPIANPQGTTDDLVTELSATIATGSDEEAAQAAQHLNTHLVEQAWYVPLYRMQYMHTTAAGVTVTPQVGLAVPSIYNYQPAA